MDSAEIGVAGEVGVYAPMSEDGAEVRLAYGGRLRFRPSPRTAVEVAFGGAADGFDPRVEGLYFLGDPIGNVVTFAAAGLGAWIDGGTTSPLVDVGVGADLRLFPVLDVRVDIRYRERLDGVGGLLLTVGSTLHTKGEFDADHDGIPDGTDPCRNEREDVDGHEDGDGCPDLDNDGDGVADLVDACREIPEDRDEFLDGDGCPDPDNDGDGVADVADGCVAVPEDADGHEDGDGCPDPDNDGDGVLDTVDACRDVPEDADGWEDGDGCPDPDNDRDGVPDAADVARDEPETYNFYEDADGRPDRVPPALARALASMQRVRFRRGQMTETSTVVVDQVLAAMDTWPEVRVRVVVSAPSAADAWDRGHVVVERIVVGGIAMERVELQVIEGRDGAYAELIPSPPPRPTSAGP